MLFGISIFVLIFCHVLLFVSAVSIRQEELSIGMLLPDFSIGYYKNGLSLGVLAFFFILIATISGILRKRLHKFWKLGHGFVYLTFALATVHGLMIGSDVNSVLLSTIVYGAVLSLVIVFVYQKSRVK